MPHPVNRVEPTPNPWPALLLLGLAAALACAAPSEEVAPREESIALPPWATPQHPVVEVPEEDVGASALEQRGREQIAAGAGEAFHGFVLRDRVMQSGIDFRHRVVDDAGRTYKPVHYDHGNGDRGRGCGRRWTLLDLYFTNAARIQNELWIEQSRGRAPLRDITVARRCRHSENKHLRGHELVRRHTTTMGIPTSTSRP